MMRREGDTISVEGPVTIHNVVATTKQGISFFEGHSIVIDLANITEVDSSIVSMLLEWLRESTRQGCRLDFVNIPENLNSLLQLYGVSTFFSRDRNNDNATN